MLKADRAASDLGQVATDLASIRGKLVLLRGVVDNITLMQAGNATLFNILLADLHKLSELPFPTYHSEIERLKDLLEYMHANKSYEPFPDAGTLLAYSSRDGQFSIS